MPSKIQDKIRFFNLKYSYLQSESIVFDLQYLNGFVVRERDFLAILPAGFLKVGHFSAIKMAPSNNNKSKSNKYNRKMPTSMSEPTNLNTKKAFQKQLNFNEKFGEMHKIVFKATTTKLAPRNFYQLAYIRSTKKEHRILATSCVFYVEMPSGMNEHQILVQQHEKNASCSLWKNLFCSPIQASSSLQKVHTYVFPTVPVNGCEDSGVEDEIELKGPQLLNKSLFHNETITTTLNCGLVEEDKSAKASQQNPAFQQAVKHLNLEEGTKADQGLTSYFTRLLSDFFGGTGGFNGSTDLRSTSMYEIGSNLMSPNGALYNCENEIKSQNEHYQKMICQLTISNSNLMRENESLAMRLKNCEELLNDHMKHLSSIYYTLFHNGYSALQFPDGEEVHLSQFRGVLLNFLLSKNSSPKLAKNEAHNFNEITSAIKETRRNFTERTSDLSSDSSISSVSMTETDELKTAMIKCITRPKYNDIDDFVNWLNQSGSVSPRVDKNSTNQQQIKSRSLEDQAHMEKLRMNNRMPLKRASRIDEVVPSTSMNQQHTRLKQNGSLTVYGALSGGQQHQPSRTLSESELRCDRASVNNFEPSSPNFSTSTEQRSSGTFSARSAKNKTARLRAQSLGGAKISSFLTGGGGGSTRRTSNQIAQENGHSPRKPLSSMRSPILTLGRAPPPKAGRNLI